MRKLKLITSVLLITMLGASFTNAIGHDELPWYFSYQLNDGNRFEWKVRFYENDSAVTSLNPDPDGDTPPFVNDSKVELEIYSNIHSIDVNGIYNEGDLNAAFNLRIDGTSQPLMDNGTISQWLLIFLNPTELLVPTGRENYFQFLIDNSETHFLLNSTGVIDSARDSYWVNEIRDYSKPTDSENRHVKEEAEYELSSGVLRYFNHYEEFYDDAKAIVGTIDAQFFLVHSDGGDGDVEFEYSHFSDLLNTGDVFTWNVTKLSGSGDLVTTIGEVGSIMEIRMLSEPENFDFGDETADPDDVLKLTFDGVLADIDEVFEFENFLNIIFPIYFDFENGTIIDNFFIYIDENPGVINLDEGEVVDIDRDANTAYHQVTRTESDGYTKTEEVTWDLTTGVMISAYFKEVIPTGETVFEVEFQRIESGDPVNTDDEDSDAPSPLPGMTYIWALTALIAIPTLRRRK
ncbi:MAG: hypothetical protein ACW99A_18115 [Candidatus Kariarchaeaceae archaeon]|jgi:hypothetical protein